MVITFELKSVYEGSTQNTWKVISATSQLSVCRTFWFHSASEPDLIESQVKARATRACERVTWKESQLSRDSFIVVCCLPLH